MKTTKEKKQAGATKTHAKKSRSKQSTTAPNTKPKAKSPSFIKKVMTLAVILVLTFAIAGAGTIAVIYATQDLSTEKLNLRANSILVYDTDGALISGDTDYIHAPIENLPDHTRWAFICVEDKNFYKHQGLSFGRIAGALYENIRTGKTKQGASTITQQLIKNTHLTHEKSLQRKLREAALALKLENKHSKQEILDAYLNVIYFGNGCYGIGTAAQYYFGKSAAELTLRESAGLAGLIRNPAGYCPINNATNFNKRADLVLSLMFAQGKITSDELASARVDTVTVTRARKSTSTAGSYKFAATAEGARLLNMDTAKFASSGYKIYTYLTPAIQDTIIETIGEGDYAIKNVAGAEADKCVIAATPDGRIVGYYASTPTLRGAKRNFASAMKPLTVYGPALELGIVTPASVIIDEDFVAGDFHPKNHDNKFHGALTVREALEQSYNVPAVKVLDYTRLTRSVPISRNLGLNLGENENMALALGTTEHGTSFGELLSGYCAIASDGTKTTPSFIKKISDSNGRTIYENTKSSLQVLQPDTCFLLKDIMRTGTKTGTAKRLDSLPFEVAAKTGTSERQDASTNTDAVICALTNDFVLLVWAGNASMQPENDLPEGTTGGGIVSFIARDIQREISKNAQPFAVPQSVEERETDASGRKEWFAKRHKAAAEVSRPISRNESFKIDGCISDSGAPMIFFTAEPTQVYEIYKRVGDIDSLQEVITKTSGEYSFFDKRTKKGKTYEYFVQSHSSTTPEVKQKSNTVKLYTASEVNGKSTAISKKRATGGKNWFF